METTRPFQPSVGKSSSKIIGVAHKPKTHRRAVPQAKALLAPDASRALRDGTNPKGDVLALAEVAGIMAAKKTADLIPLCHPLPLQAVRVSFVLDDAEGSVTVFCEASAIARTGVEMEALAGVTGALLTVYDLSKAVNPAITLGTIRLNLKEGGKSGVWNHPEAQGTVPNTTAHTGPKPPASELLGA